jgi:polysaccharide export outer membrane protein
MGARSFKVQLQKTGIGYGALLQKTLNTKGTMSISKTLLLVFIPVMLLLGSCANVNSNILFKISKNSKFKYDTIPLVPEEDFKLAPGDRFSFLFGTNNGEKIILSQSGVTGSNGQSNGGNNNTIMQNSSQNRLTYLVRQDGIANIPLLDEVYVAGKTIVELENYIKVLLSTNYINPYVQIRVTNQRVIVFPGRGDAQVVNLRNANTSLLEVIALAGGIRNEARSNSIKLMRKMKNGKREIYLIDLSTISGLNNAQMIVQSNDYIYIDFKPRYASAVLQELTPWLSLLTTSLLTYNIFKP